MKKGNQRGPAYAYNVKALRDQETAVAEQAEHVYEQFVGQWRSKTRKKRTDAANAAGP